MGERPKQFQFHGFWKTVIDWTTVHAQQKAPKNYGFPKGHELGLLAR